MQPTITSLQREKLEKALKLFIEAFRDYIVKMLSNQYGEAHWPNEYRKSLKPDQQTNWEREKSKGRSAHDLIDYSHLQGFSIYFKHNVALKADFQEEVHMLPSRLSHIYYKIRNRIRHDENDIPQDDYAQFWLHVRAIARSIKNPSLYEAMNALENEGLEKALEKEQALLQSEVNIKVNELLPTDDPLKEQPAFQPKEQVIEVPKASYFLPILVRGQKSHLVHLCANGVTNNRLVRSFIYEQSGHSITLFSLMEGVYQGRSALKSKGYCQLKELRKEGPHLMVVLEEVALLTYAEVDCPEGLNVLYRGKNVTVECQIEMEFDKIIFQLFESGQSYTGEIETCFAPPQCISDVAMDFGSEASQIVVHTRGRGAVLRRFPLLKEMHEQFYPNLQGPFHQEDSLEKSRPDNEKGFFRSQVFIKKSEAIFFKEDQPNSHQNHDLVCTLNREDDVEILKNSHFLIANPKLAHLGAYGNFEIRFKDLQSNESRSRKNDFGELVTEIQQAIIYHFLHAVLKRLDQHEGRNNPRYINIKFLVPNVLDQSAVSALINHTYRFLRTPQITDTYQIKGVEVGTLSESDASFLGYWQQEETICKANAKYLLLDCGKGTMDFSIIESNDQMELSSTFRLGFIGAGNVITYAFIETVVSAFLGNQATDANRQKLLRIITSAFTDMVQQNAFLEITEGFKHNYKPTKLKPLSALLTTEKRQEVVSLVLSDDNPSSNVLNIINSALKDILKSHKSIADEFGFINSAVQALVGQITREVAKAIHDSAGDRLSQAFHKVILTGRGFLFGPLETQMRQSFPQIFLPFHTAHELKSICLSGAFSGRIINYDSNLVGIPRLHTQMSKMIGKQHVAFEKIEDGANTSTHVNDDDWMENTHQLFSKFFGEGKKARDDFDDVAPSPATVASTAPPIASELVKFLTEGSTLNAAHYQASQHKISISGVKYICDGYDGPVDLMFDGERIWMRTTGGLKALKIPSGFFGSQPMVWKTLYPFFNATAKEHTPIDSLQTDPDEII